MSLQTIGYVSRMELVNGTKSVEDVINSFSQNFANPTDAPSLSSYTVKLDAQSDGYQVNVSLTEDQKITYQGMTLNTNSDIVTITTRDSTNYDPNDPQWKFVQTPNIWTSPSITIPAMPSSPGIYPQWDGSTVELLEAKPAELSDESKALLKSVEEKVSELLGKHPYARMANMRKALDELLKALPEGQFEGTYRKLSPLHLPGWEACFSYRPEGMTNGFCKEYSGPMPTEEEALAELIRRLTSKEF